MSHLCVICLFTDVSARRGSCFILSVWILDLELMPDPRRSGSQELPARLLGVYGRKSKLLSAILRPLQKTRKIYTPEKGGTTPPLASHPGGSVWSWRELRAWSVEMMTVVFTVSQNIRNPIKAIRRSLSPYYG